MKTPLAILDPQADDAVIDRFVAALKGPPRPAAAAHDAPRGPQAGPRRPITGEAAKAKDTT